jgi:hypothetical protein
MTVGEQIISFLFNLRLTLTLPEDIKVLNPFPDEETKSVVREFYTRYYNDNGQRWMIIGINPGRFGGGITGIPFTDPVRLEKECKIENRWQKKQELSSVFIYDMIREYGGVEAFYKDFYISAVSPLGFTKDNKNLNYYDDKSLQENIKPFAVDCINKQLDFGINRNVAFCLGDGKNFKFLNALNNEHKFFGQLIPLSHPRFIMQYKLKTKANYLNLYMEAFRKWCT